MNDFIKIGVQFPKENVRLPSQWNKITKSIYNNEKNYAVLTGKINNIIVVDLDKKEETFVGKIWFEKNFGKIEECKTLITKTINGGYHIYFKYCDKIKNMNNKKLHIDILSDNKCCYQGENYNIINDTNIKELSDNEINIINTLASNKEPKEINYKKANELFNTPDNTKWQVVKSNKGYKCVPQCSLCLIDPLKEHTHEEHSALFINNDKSVIKSCFSCGSEVLNKSESKKALSVFNIVLNTQENTVYQELVSDLIIHCKEYKYKREKNTGIVYKQVKPYAYIKHLEPMDFLNKVFYGVPEFKSNVNNMDNLIKFMKQYDDEDFPFIEYNKDYIGFSNGILNIKTCEFFENEENVTVYKYIDQEFNYSTDTPLFDLVLNYQFEPDVRDFIYGCLGRMFGIRDNYGFMLYLLGEPGCGKSLILDILCECFNNIGSIGNSFEEKFGLSFLYDRDIIVCDDLPKNISKIFPQQTFQTCITGGKIPIAVKGGNGFTVDWNVPMLWAGNFWIDYIDKGQISRRMLVANFEKNIINPDPTLKKRIIQNELPAFIYKCLIFYKNMLNNNANKDIWKICPEYFLDQQQELKVERNPLYKFLLENTRYKADNIVLLESARNKFNNWLGKNVKSLDNGTFFQVNKDYIIKTMKICKHCAKEGKKSCCELYKNSDRTVKKIVRNMEFIENNDIDLIDEE